MRSEIGNAWVGQKRWTKAEDVHQEQWTQAEDERLAAKYQAHPREWATIAKEMGMNRSARAIK